MKKDNNTGDFNTGDFNTGDFNTGYYNTGDCNTGYYNTGYFNTGYYNTGNCNTGYYNTGDFNTGDSNTGDSNTGLFNTNEPKARLFNKECDFTFSELADKNLLPSMLEFYLTKFISESEMNDEEKKENPNYKTVGGYLKVYSYKEAWANFWRDTDEDNRKKFLALPNFDPKIFTEITGIEPNKPNFSGKTVRVIFDGQELEAVIK